MGWRRHLKIILSYQARRRGRLDTLNSKIHPLFQILDTETGCLQKFAGGCKKNAKSFFLVPFFTTMEVAAPLKNYPILSGRSTGSFRHLELQNPSIISDFINRDRMVRKSEKEEEEEEEERKT